jgi:dienelactone hydrolase
MLYGWLWLAVASAADPLPVSWQDVSFDDPTAGRVDARLYHPAPGEAGGPWPLAVFLHGWLGSAWMYDELGSALAAQGYVVASLDTETGLVLDMDDFADDAVAVLHWVEAASAERGNELEGLVSDEPWTALGHSMGGATLARLLGLEPQIRTAVAFMPYEGLPSYYETLETWSGSLLLLSGTHDTTAPPAMQHRWMDSADQTARSLLLELTDMGHKGVTDLTFDEDPMPDDLQREIVISLATDFVLAEQGGDESLWASLIGPGLGELEVQRWSRSHAPALWATLQDGEISLGVAGLPGEAGEVLIGSAPSDEGLLDAISVGALPLEAGVGELTVAVPATWAGDLWVRVRLEGEDGERWTRAAPLITGTEPGEPGEPAEPGEPGGPEAPATAQEQPAQDSHGCATRFGPAVTWAWMLGLAYRRRSGRPRQ